MACLHAPAGGKVGPVPPPPLPAPGLLPSGSGRGARAPRGPPFRELSGFDRLAVVGERVENRSLERVYVTTRRSATKSTTTIFRDAEGSPRSFDALAWSPGAASLATTEFVIPTNPTAADRLRVYEFPSGPIKTLDTVLDALRPATNLFREVGRVRWTGTGTPLSVRLRATVSQAGLVSIGPDGSGGSVVRPELPPGAGWSGRRAPRRSLRVHEADRVRRLPGSLFVEGTGSKPERQLTSTAFASEHAPAVSPNGTRIAYLQGANGDHRPNTNNANDRDKPSTLAIVDVDGTDQSLISPDTSIAYRAPAWSPDGARIGFIGQIRTTGTSPPLRFDQVIFSITPDGTDLVRHTPIIGNLDDPNPWASTRGPGFADGLVDADYLAWGRTCLTITSCASSPTLVGGRPAGLPDPIAAQAGQRGLDRIPG